jgi:Protein of unknown function (DUF1549)
MVRILLTLAISAAALTAAEKPTLYDSPSAPTAHGKLDDLVSAQWRSLGIQPAQLCSDAVFVRRAYLDIIGTLPTAAEAAAFLADPDPAKRATLIDRLLDRDEFADYWATKWSDILRVKAEFPINLWPNAAQAYYHWLRASIQANKPYDQFARELLTGSGSNFRSAPVNFYRAMQNREPQGVAQTVALTFMATRLEKWPADRQAGMAAFFAQIGYKDTDEWKEQIVFFDPAKKAAAPVFPDGTPARIAPGHRESRLVLAAGAGNRPRPRRPPRR